MLGTASVWQNAGDAGVLLLAAAAACALILAAPTAPAASSSRHPSATNADSTRFHLQHHRRRVHQEAHAAGITHTTCEARCWKHFSKNACINSCLRKGFDKLGSCSNLIEINADGQTASNGTDSPFYVACHNDCRRDSDCPGTRKCCKHHCGRSCQPVDDLLLEKGLPDIPIDLQAKRRKKALYIEWEPSRAPIRQTIFYILEERRQTNFLESFSEWSTRVRTIGKASVLLRNFVRPGEIHQFRVASVNENGTMGFSHPITFMAKLGPKAPAVTIGTLYYVNGSLETEIEWVPPKSELPIDKYKIFWSKRLYGATLTALESVLVLQQTVSGDTTKYIIHDLEPNSMYFIQVQAIIQFDDETIRGEKSGYVLYTNLYKNLSTVERQGNPMGKHQIEELQLDKLYWSKTDDDLKARISWKPNGRNIMYNISWWSGPCKNNKTSYSKLTAITRHGHFDVYDLNFDCRYKVNVKQSHNRRMRNYSAMRNSNERIANGSRNNLSYETSVTFRTPSCKSLQARYKRLKFDNVLSWLF